MYGRNVSLHISRSHARALIPQVLELMTSGRLHPEAVTTTVAPMDDAPKALHAHLTRESTKVILTA
jgi:alcohol dehydrogenase